MQACRLASGRSAAGPMTGMMVDVSVSAAVVANLNNPRIE